MMECFAVYIAYKMTDGALLQPIRFTRIFISSLWMCEINVYLFQMKKAQCIKRRLKSIHHPMIRPLMSEMLDATLGCSSENYLGKVSNNGR